MALFALVYALIEANSRGWTSPLILGLFALALVAGTAFVLLELHQRLPLFDMTLFRNPTFAGANTVALLVSLAMFGVFFFISLYMQNVLGYSAVRAGRRVPADDDPDHPRRARSPGASSDRLGSRWLMTAGMTMLSGALLVFAQLQTGLVVLPLLPGMLLGGVGMAVDDDADDRRRTQLRAGRQGGCRLRDAQHVPPGRRLARDRRDGRDPRGGHQLGPRLRRRRRSTRS